MSAHAGSPTTQPLKPVPFTDVKFHDAFWAPRLETNRTVTIPHDFHMCEKTGRIANFARAAGREKGDFQGIYFDDSDVYKVIEGAAYSLATHPDPKLDKYLDDLIDTIAAAQQPDGYLFTFYTIKGLDQRYTNLKDMHELYCAGHLIEAAVAHKRATGKDSLLNVAIKLADHIDSIFGPDKRHGVPGHEEIELALFKLADLTGEKRYETLANFFVDERGHTACGRKLTGPYHQDVGPVIDQQEVMGHAVRQMYLLCAMTDYAARAGDPRYRAAVDRLFDDLVGTKMYVTGGIGSRHEGEAFGDAFELPNETAYNETCAAIGNALWNHRMNLLHGDAKYFDVVERVLYNGFLSGVGLGGDKFFYVNPLASDGKHHRKEWYKTACCPVNVVRFLPSLPGYAYATRGDAIYVNLYAKGEATIDVVGQKVKIAQDTRYPWGGTVLLTVIPQKLTALELRLRIPGWCDASTIGLSVNGERVEKRIEQGYLVIDRGWKSGDRVQLTLPMPIQRVKSDPRVKANVGRVALQRGPVVYCVEAADNGGKVSHLRVKPDDKFVPEFRDDLLGGVNVIKGPDGFVAIPYYAWDHRAPGEMAVWLAEE
ncbi:MAG TPA: beta-L-arabinofuranosidase domain-containing protein [Tepidisphaeraceae bacterium]|nr:beta-L-arabinofuranosidase domain-containing protein [Tepidisphaeraceae bacterium]